MSTNTETYPNRDDDRRLDHRLGKFYGNTTNGIVDMLCANHLRIDGNEPRHFDLFDRAPDSANSVDVLS